MKCARRQPALGCTTLWLATMFLATLFLASTFLASTVRVVAAQPQDGDAASEPAQAAVEETAPQVDGSVTTPADGDQPAVQMLGQGDQKLYVVDHGGTWSMHVENVMTEELVRLWKEAGGPQVIAKTPLDRPYTLSVHKLSPERIFERLLDGFDYTLHYDAGGRLERVRVYSLDPSAASVFKTPRLVESLGSWREVETTAPSATVSPTAAAPASSAVPAPPSNP